MRGIEADDLLLEGVMACAWQMEIRGVADGFPHLSKRLLEHEFSMEIVRQVQYREGPTAHFSHFWC